MCEGGLTFPPAVVLLIITYSDSSLRPSLRSQLTGVRAHVPTPCCETARNCERILRDCGRLRCPRLRTRWSWSSQVLVAEGREVRRPSHSRCAVAFDERYFLARSCERSRILRPALVGMVGRLVEVLHVGVVTVDRHTERPDAEDRDPKRLEAPREQRFAALELPVRLLHGEAKLALPVLEPVRRGIE